MKSQRQQQIVEEAIKIIDKKGIQGLTIKNLSKAIGISEPAIYRHFESKTEIILSVLDILCDAADLFSTMLQPQEEHAMVKIRMLIERMVSLFTENPSLVSVIFAEEIFKNETVLKEKIVSVLNKNEETLESIIKNGQHAGNVRTDLATQSLALIIMGSFRLLVKRWYMGQYQFSLQKEAAQLLNTFETIINKK